LENLSCQVRELTQQPFLAPTELKAETSNV
jgi:hypothetical protein